MIRPARLEIQNFRGWRNGTVELAAPVCVLVGANRAGKSSTLNALEWCLFGDEVEKKSSGIAERADWQAANVASDAVEVAITFAGARDDARGDVSAARVTRRRAGPRASDELVVDAGGERFVGDAARAWMQRAGLPDWATWRRAFCQHQELARARLVDTADRSSILAGLLGLEAYDASNAKLRELRPAALIQQLDAAQDRLETLVQQRLRRPEEELAEVEARLAALGIERANAGARTALDVAARMLARARALDGALRLGATLPQCAGESDLPAVASWADGFSNVVRNERRSAERAAEVSKLRGALIEAAGAFEPAETRAKLARAKLDDAVRERGDVATLNDLIAKAEAAERAADAALRAQDALLALLGDAREVLRASADGGTCPVCESRTSDLASRLDAALASGRAAASSERAGEAKRAKERTATVRDALRAVESAARDDGEARKALEAVAQRLRALVPETRVTSRAGDVLAAARDEIGALTDESARLQTASAERERELDAHRRDLDLLRELQKWQAASSRAAHRTSLDAAPSHERLQRALDDAAAFAVDLEALGALGREAQEELSARRESEVNARLGAYFALVTGDASGESARVRVKRTAKGLSYDLEDARGERSLATLNQASLNALSLALLFAQAEARAGSDAPAWIVLDDPAQSLDPLHQAGLARAIERVALACPVIVATPEGPLATALVASHGAALVRLAPWNASRGAEVVR